MKKRNFFDRPLSDRIRNEKTLAVKSKRHEFTKKGAHTRYFLPLTADISVRDLNGFGKEVLRRLDKQLGCEATVDLVWDTVEVEITRGFMTGKRYRLIKRLIRRSIKTVKKNSRDALWTRDTDKVEIIFDEAAFEAVHRN